MIPTTRFKIAGALFCLAVVLSACSSQARDTVGSGDPISTAAAIPSPTPGSPTGEPLTLPPTEETREGDQEPHPVLPLSPQPSLTLQPGTISGQIPGELLAAIRADLADRLQVGAEELAVVQAQTASWPDSSLGCPQTGMNYQQVIVDGYWIVLRYDEGTYDYRAGDRGDFILCEQSESLLPGTIEPGLEALVEMAKDDLALRLSVSAGQIAVLEARAVVWPDSSLGCPKPGMGYLQVLQEGTLIRLRVGPIQYEYHSGGSRDPFFCDQLSPRLKGTEPAVQEPLPLNPDSN